jgi:hypothetical protein
VRSGSPDRRGRRNLKIAKNSTITGTLGGRRVSGRY